MIKLYLQSKVMIEFNQDSEAGFDNKFWARFCTVKNTVLQS
jgi:hypothetical protein